MLLKVMDEIDAVQAQVASLNARTAKDEALVLAAKSAANSALRGLASIWSIRRSRCDLKRSR